MAYVDMQLVNGPELKAQIKALNETGLLPEPIMIKKLAVADLASLFVKGIEAINAVGKLDDVPDVIYGYYGGIMKPGDPPAELGAGVTKETGEQTAEEAAAEVDAGAAELTAAEKKKQAAAAKKAAKKAPAKLAKKAPAKPAKPKPKTKTKAPMVKSAVFGKTLLGKKKKWTIKELVDTVAAKTDSPAVDTRRKCNAYVALLETMGVLERTGDNIHLTEWYTKAKAGK